MTATIPAQSRHRFDILAAIAASVPGTAEARAAEDGMERLRESHPALRKPDLDSASSWKGATNRLIRHYTNTGACFSAGEIAREIRIGRPDIAFACESIANHLRIRWLNRSLTYDGRLAMPVHRYTEGSSRSPRGSTVIVYAPTEAEGEAHAFEVDIPRGGQRALGAGS